MTLKPYGTNAFITVAMHGPISLKHFLSLYDNALSRAFFWHLAL